MYPVCWVPTLHCIALYLEATLETSVDSIDAFIQERNAVMFSSQGAVKEHSCKGANYGGIRTREGYKMNGLFWFKFSIFLL